jgi:Cytochrome P460
MTMQRSLIAGAAGLALAAGFAAATRAGPEVIAFPDGYATKYTLYGIIDRPDRSIVRFFYVNPEALAKSKAGQPAPEGTVLVMADKKAKLGADGKPVRDADGRFIAEGDFTAVAVQAKGKGWGADVPPNLKNGDWQYAAFKPDGSRNDAVKYDACFTCHKARETRGDYTFLYEKFLQERPK